MSSKLIIFFISFFTPNISGYYDTQTFALWCLSILPMESNAVNKVEKPLYTPFEHLLSCSSLCGARTASARTALSLQAGALEREGPERLRCLTAARGLGQIPTEQHPEGHAVS